MLFVTEEEEGSNGRTVERPKPVSMNLRASLEQVERIKELNCYT